MIAIRRARAEDFAKGLVTCLESFGEITMPTHELGWQLDYRDNTRVIDTFVAVEAGVVMGTASLLIEPKLLHDGRAAGHVEDVATHPEHRHKGVASSLIKHIIEYARQRCFYKLILDCDQSLVSFYEQFGFRVNPGGGMRLDLK